MKCFSVTALFVLFCVIYVHADDNKPLNWNPKEEERSWRLNGQVGHSPGTGTNVFVDGEKSVWREGNNEVRVGGNFGKHYGGPYGRSPPSYEGRVIYNRRFRRQLPAIDPSKPYTLNAAINRGQSVTTVQTDGTVRLWQSPNQYQQVHGTGFYNQAFTPHGNSRPVYGVGVGYNHRF